MIETAKKCKNFSIKEDDFKTFNLNSKFDTAISLFHVVSYLTTNVEIELSFKNVFNHLNTKGLFIFDFWYAPAVLTEKPSVRVKTFSNEKYKITRIATPENYPNLNKVVVNYDFFIENKKTGKFVKFTEKHPMRYFSLPEIELFANKSGFKIISSEEWLSGKIPSFNTWGVCVVLQKKWITIFLSMSRL